MTDTDEPPLPGLEHRTRSGVLTVAVVFLLIGLVAVWVGVTTASTHGSFGPHEARYDVTTTGLFTVDLGPLGNVEMDSPVPLGLGAKVTVEEIPEDVTAVDPSQSLEGLSKDLQSYLQFFASPQTALDDAVEALIRDAVVRSLWSFGLMGLAVVGARALVGGRRRDELRLELAPHRRTVTVSGLLVCLALGTLASSSRTTPVPEGHPVASSIFAGTALEGARITGRLAGIIDTYGGYAVQTYRANQEFYRGATDSLRVAWGEHQALVGPAAASASPSASPPLSPSPVAPVTSSPTASQTPALAGGSPADPHIVTLALISDVHCNVGMAEVLGELVTLSGAQLVLDAGDTTINGTTVEQYCVTAIARALPHDVEVVVSDGNHDSALTSAQERHAGMTVLDGKTVTIKGIRILGDSDPRATRIGQGTSLVAGESVEEEGTRLADVACAGDRPVDLFLIHTPPVGDEVLNRGCATTQISGHTHQWAGPERFGLGVRLVSGSTAGALLGEPTVGPLRGTASLALLRFNTDTHRFVDYQRVQVHPDGTAVVGLVTAFPLPSTLLPEVLHDATGVPPGAQ